MKIKKLFKYLPITMMAAGLAVAATTPSISLLNNSDYLKNQIFNVDQTVDETEYTDQLEYIRNDVAKQDDVTNSVASIKLADSSSNTSHSAALVTKTDGSTLLYMWGQNTQGQLGNGTSGSSTNTSTPTLVTTLSGKKITQIALGQYHSAALLDDGSLYMWGWNNNGQLGNEINIGTSNPTPTQVTIPDSTSPITKIALSRDSSALLEDGSLYMWGNNYYGQLGSTTNNGNNNPNATPTKVTINSAFPVAQIALAETHSAALLDDGSLYMWGGGGSGRLGYISDSSANPTPTKVNINSTSPVIQIALGYEHSAALLADGSLYTWGSNNYGQLGNETNVGTDTANPTPTKVIMQDPTSQITQIALGYRYSAALLGNGRLYMWGNNQYGQLGNEINIGTNTPNHYQVPVTIISTSKITRIALGAQFSAALLDDGSLYMWGRNNYGQLGFAANATHNPTPTWMYKLGKDSHITANLTLTAKEAVDNIWVDNKFNLTGFKNSFNLTNILETTDQEITMDTKPTYDNATGTVTMTVKIKYFYNEDGLLVPDTAAKEMTINGFVPAAAEDQNPATDNQDPFPWWWIIIGIGGAAIIGVGIWFVIKKRKEAEAKPTDGEPDSKDPKDDEKKTSETEAKSEEAAKTDIHSTDKTAEETKTEEASKPKSLKKTKK